MRHHLALIVPSICFLSLIAACSDRAAGVSSPGDAGPHDEQEDGQNLVTSTRRADMRVPLLVHPYGLFVEVSFDGKGPVIMKVDTGAPSSVIDTDRARALGIRAGSPVASIHGADLGRRRLGTTAWPNADQVFSGMPGAVVGVVGNDFFAGYTVGLNYRDGEMWLYPSGAATARLETPEGVGELVVVPMDQARGYLVVRCGFFPGSDEDCLFDTGAIFSMAFEEYFRRVPPPDREHRIPMFTIDSNGRPMTAYYQRAAAVRAGALSVSGDVTCVFPSFPLVTTVGEAIGRPLVGLVGMLTTLGYFTAIDYENDRLLFYPYPGKSHLPKSPFVGFGLVPGAGGTNGLRVGAVVPGSSAEAAGVRANDELRTIDGAPLDNDNCDISSGGIIAGPAKQRRRFGLSRDGVAIEVEIEAEDLLPPL